MNVIVCAHLRAGYNIVHKLNKYKNIKLYVYTYNSKDNEKLINYCRTNNIMYTFNSINESLECVKDFKPDYLLSIYYRDIINENILKMIKKRTANLHPSLLPKYRGCFSAPWVIINDEKITGITYHEMQHKVDTGKIWLQNKILLHETDTAFSLYNKLVDLGTDSFNDFWINFTDSNFKGTPQEGKSSFYHRKLPFDGKINLEWSYEKIERFIRAMHFPPHDGAVLEINNCRYIIESFSQFCQILKKENKNLERKD